MRTSHPFTATQEFCEILGYYQRYLYENCSFDECEKTCVVNRIAASTLAMDEVRIDLEGRILSHQAQVADELGNFQKAIELCRQEIEIRRAESPKKYVLLSFSTSNLGIFYFSANAFAKAMECFHESREWWKAYCADISQNCEYDASMLIYETRCKICLGEYEKAREMLGTVIAQTKDKMPLNFWVLAFAQFCTGTLDRLQHKFKSAEAHFMEAQNTWLRSDQTRLHPFNASILYKLGACCLDQGKVEASIKHIKDSIEVTEFHHRAMPVAHGRNLFKLSEALLQNGNDDISEAMELREKAEFFLKMKSNAIQSGTENDYDNLIPIGWR